MILQGNVLGAACELWALRDFDAAAIVLPDCAKEFCLVLFDWENVAYFVKEIEER
jgi:hypothetical protein